MHPPANVGDPPPSNLVRSRNPSILTEHADRPAAQISAEIGLALHRFMGQARPTDDVTYVVVKITPDQS